MFKVVQIRSFKKINCFINQNYTVQRSINSDNNLFIHAYKSAYIPTTLFQKLALGVGSALMSLKDPSRGDMIAILGEASGSYALKHMHKTMLENPEGREILRDAARINSRTVDIDKLQSLPENTVGKIYYKFLKDNKVSPDSRLPVQFVDDVDLAYTMQRYRETHDLNHAILGMPTNMLGEVTVKWVEAYQTRLPMCIGGALFGAMRLKPKQRQKYISTHLPWAIRTGINSNQLLCVYFEKRWEQDISDLQKELNIVPLKVT